MTEEEFILKPQVYRNDQWEIVSQEDEPELYDQIVKIHKYHDRIKTLMDAKWIRVNEKN